MLDDSPYWTRQRRELFRWLVDHTPSFADGYLAAIRILHAAGFPARVHLVCHVVRDIYRNLPAALGGDALPRPSEVLPTMAKELAKQWEASLTSRDGCPKSIGSELSMTTQVYRCVTKLVDKCREMAEQPSVGKHLAIALFRSGDRREDEFIQPWVIRSFDAEYDFFVRRAHLARRVDRVPTDERLVEHFEAFERALPLAGRLVLYG